MKVEVNENKQVQEREFPKLMIGLSGSIVLFTEHRVGICLRANRNDEDLGEYFDDWNMSNFKDFNGSITLSND